MVRPPADILLPCIAVYRESEDYEGTEPGFREFTAKVMVKYYAGRQSFGTPLEEAWGALHDIVRRVDQALILGAHPSWDSGINLSHSAGVASIEALQGIYSAELPDNPNPTHAYPAVTIPVSLVHHEVQDVADEAVLSKMFHHFDIDAHPSWAKTATLNAVGPVTATWTPILSGVTIVLSAVGPEAIAVVDRRVTINLIPGASTYASIAALWNGSTAAAALATITGTAGTVAGAYPGEILNLWYDDLLFGFDSVVTQALV
jgi:hypothetical protein